MNTEQALDMHQLNVRAPIAIRCMYPELFQARRRRERSFLLKT